MNIAFLRIPALLLGAALLYTAPASAMPGSDGSAPRLHDPAARFAKMDSNASGSVTWAEFHTARPNLNENAFKSIDANADGSIDLTEWTSFSTGHGGNVAKPDMNSMMKSMGSMLSSGANKAEEAQPSPAPSAPSSMPLIMPPSQSSPKPAPQKAMPLIMPPAAGK